MQCNVDIQNKEFPSDSLTNANKVYDMVARPLMSGIFSVVCGMFDISGRVIENVHHNSKVRGTEQKLEYFQRKLETLSGQGAVGTSCQSKSCWYKLSIKDTFFKLMEEWPTKRANNISQSRWYLRDELREELLDRSSSMFSALETFCGKIWKQSFRTLRDTSKQFIEISSEGGHLEYLLYFLGMTNF